MVPVLVALSSSVSERLVVAVGVGGGVTNLVALCVCETDTLVLLLALISPDGDSDPEISAEGDLDMDALLRDGDGVGEIVRGNVPLLVEVLSSEGDFDCDST